MTLCLMTFGKSSRYEVTMVQSGPEYIFLVGTLTMVNYAVEIPTLENYGHKGEILRVFFCTILLFVLILISVSLRCSFTLNSMEAMG